MENRHRLSLIIATLGPSTDDPQELKTMIIAGIARQWTDGVDIARILHSDGESIVKDRAHKFREESEKRKCKTSIYLDTDDRDSKNFTKYLDFAKELQPEYISIFKKIGLEKIKEAKLAGLSESKIGVRYEQDDSTDDIESFLKEADFIMLELDSKKIADEKLVGKSKENNCEPIYLARMPTLMKGQVQSRDENFEIGHTLELGFDIVALYQETSHGPYPARSVKCIDEIAVESEKLRMNPIGDFFEKILSIFRKK
ncbi:MAG: hypothetical protein VX864_04565 [Pseudomonadota bacterium]|nr:hypothetical protein [Pseudomonadota bacterium]MED5430645.1 hypothetical protein [Pseudomonadota bacterium]|tara:strand:- start:10 stop:777 length:768 start_codon:yes stop_codon:yes gene_type:complete